jgi:hypothetical protein
MLDAPTNRRRAHQASYSLSTRRPFTGGEAAVARSPPLTSIFLLRLRMSGAIPLFTPNAFMPVTANVLSDFIRFRSHLALTSCHPTLDTFYKRDHKRVNSEYTTVRFSKHCCDVRAVEFLVRSRAEGNERLNGRVFGAFCGK